MAPSDGSRSTSRGAYGLALAGLPGQRWLGDAHDEWTPWRFQVDSSPVIKRPPQKVDDDEGFLYTAPRGFVHIDRRRAVTTVSQGRVPGADGFAHPLLVSTALVVAGWQERLSFHGGAILDRDGHAWGVLANHENGKGMFLGWCATNDVRILSSDLVVTDGTQVFAGPRCLDLRQDEADHFGIGCDIGVLGTRRRWRVGLGEVPPSAPLRGWLAIDWGKAVGLRKVGTVERVELLKRSQRISIAHHHQRPWLEALSTTTLSLTRPRDSVGLETSMSVLLNALESVASRSKAR